MRPKPNIRTDTGASSGVPQPVGLLVGTKGAQLHRFRRVLQQAGYRVEAVNVPAEVIRLATEQEVDVILYNGSFRYSALVQGYRSFARRPALIRLHADQVPIRITPDEVQWGYERECDIQTNASAEAE